MSEKEGRSIRGVPLRERTEAEVRAALAERCEGEEADAFVRLWRYAVDERVGISALAHQSGISSTTLSQCFNGAEAYNYPDVAERIRTFFWRLEQREKYGGLREFVETGLARDLWTVFEKTRVIRRIQLVQSPEQCGKTRAAVEYTKRNDSGRTVYVSLPGGTRSGFGDFIWALAETLGIPYTIKTREKRLRIAHALAACDLLILDELHVMDNWTDQDQRLFWDYVRTDLHANGERGVVGIATNSDVLANLQRFRRRAGYNVGQLLGRMRNEIVHVDPAEDIREGDVEALVSRYYKPGREAVRKLHALCQREQLGHFGLLQDVLNEAWTKAKAGKRPLTDETVLDTARAILAELEQRKDLYK